MSVYEQDHLRSSVNVTMHKIRPGTLPGGRPGRKLGNPGNHGNHGKSS